MINYYEILEVSEKASDEIIEKAYKVLAKKYHPDLQQDGDKKTAEEKMKLINEAYEILSEKDKREEFDKKLSAIREHGNRAKVEQEKENNYQNQNYEHRKNGEHYNYKNYEEEQKNINNYYKEQIRMQQEYQERLEREARIRYAKAYENYLRSLGYKIKHRWTWERIKALIITIIVMITIAILLWLIPYSREILIKLYQENFLVKLIVDIIGNILKAFIDIFKN